MNKQLRTGTFVHINLVLCRCHTWSLTLKEEHRLRVFMNTVSEKVFGPKREEVQEAAKTCITISFTICSPLQLPVG